MVITGRITSILTLVIRQTRNCMDIHHRLRMMDLTWMDSHTLRDIEIIRNLIAVVLRRGRGKGLLLMRDRGVCPSRIRLLGKLLLTAFLL